MAVTPSALHVLKYTAFTQALSVVKYNSNFSNVQTDILSSLQLTTNSAINAYYSISEGAIATHRISSSSDRVSVCAKYTDASKVVTYNFWSVLVDNDSTVTAEYAVVSTSINVIIGINHSSDGSKVYVLLYDTYNQLNLLSIDTGLNQNTVAKSIWDNQIDFIGSYRAIFLTQTGLENQFYLGGVAYENYSSVGLIHSSIEGRRTA